MNRYPANCSGNEAFRSYQSFCDRAREAYLYLGEVLGGFHGHVTPWFLVRQLDCAALFIGAVASLCSTTKAGRPEHAQRKVSFFVDGLRQVP